MNVIEALQQRKSVRAFLKKDVSKDKVNTILEAASHSPSGANIQPWQVAIVTAEAKQTLQTKLEEAFREDTKNGITPKPDYVYYPKIWEEPYKSRRIACGMQLYSALKIKRDDKQRRLDQWIANYRAFDAPVMLLFFMDANMQTGSYLDYGMFLQSVMLAAVDQGLATCPQAALTDYPEIIKTSLDYPKDSILLCGMALTYLI